MEMYKNFSNYAHSLTQFFFFTQGMSFKFLFQQSQKDKGKIEFYF